MSDTPPVNRMYLSPTTPGLRITFQARVIEQLCLNAHDGPLPPRFWSDPKWARRWRMECRGVKLLLDALGPITNDLFAKAIVEAIRRWRIHSLRATKIRTKVGRLAKRVYHELKDRRDRLVEGAEPARPDGEYVDRNARFMTTPSSGRLDRLREAEVAD